MTHLTNRLPSNAPIISAAKYRPKSFFSKCFVTRKPIVTDGLKCAMDILPNAYTASATATAGARATTTTQMFRHILHQELPNLLQILQLQMSQSFQQKISFG